MMDTAVPHMISFLRYWGRKHSYRSREGEAGGMRAFCFLCGAARAVLLRRLASLRFLRRDTFRPPVRFLSQGLFARKSTCVSFPSQKSTTLPHESATSLSRMPFRFRSHKPPTSSAAQTPSERRAIRFRRYRLKVARARKSSARSSGRENEPSHATRFSQTEYMGRLLQVEHTGSTLPISR